jgi:hypothetical protein
MPSGSTPDAGGRSAAEAEEALARSEERLRLAQKIGRMGTFSIETLALRVRELLTHNLKDVGYGAAER